MSDSSEIAEAVSTALDPETAVEFNVALETLLRQATDAGVSVEGGWDCRNGGDSPDWDVVITELEKE